MRGKSKTESYNSYLGEPIKLNYVVTKNHLGMANSVGEAPKRNKEISLSFSSSLFLDNKMKVRVKHKQVTQLWILCFHGASQLIKDLLQNLNLQD